MTLEIISAHEVMFKGEADSVTLPGELGQFTVLRNHAPIISVLVEGKVSYRTSDGSEKDLSIILSESFILRQYKGSIK